MMPGPSPLPQCGSSLGLGPRRLSGTQPARENSTWAITGAKSGAITGAELGALTGATLGAIIVTKLQAITGATFGSITWATLGPHLGHTGSLGLNRLGKTQHNAGTLQCKLHPWKVFINELTAHIIQEKYKHFYLVCVLSSEI